MNEVVCMTQPGPVAKKIEGLALPVYFLRRTKESGLSGGFLKLRFMASRFHPISSNAGCTMQT